MCSAFLNLLIPTVPHRSQPDFQSLAGAPLSPHDCSGASSRLERKDNSVQILSLQLGHRIQIRQLLSEAFQHFCTDRQRVGRELLRVASCSNRPTPVNYSA